MRLKFKRINHMRILWLLIFICIIISTILFATPMLYVKQIDITGNGHYKTEEIIAQAGISYGMHILQFQKSRSEKQLRELAYLDTVEMKIIPPSGIQINITERKPIGYVPFSGTYLCIDKQGQVIDQKEVGEAYGIPVVEGLKFNKFKLGEVLQVDNEEGIIATIELTTLMEKYNLLDKTVRIDVANPSQIHLYIDTLDVIIGEMKDYDRKIQWLSKVLEKHYEMGVLDLSNVSKGQAIMSPKM